MEVKMDNTNTRVKLSSCLLAGLTYLLTSLLTSLFYFPFNFLFYFLFYFLFNFLYLSILSSKTILSNSLSHLKAKSTFMVCPGLMV